MMMFSGLSHAKNINDTIFTNPKWDIWKPAKKIEYLPALPLNPEMLSLIAPEAGTEFEEPETGMRSMCREYDYSAVPEPSNPSEILFVIKTCLIE